MSVQAAWADDALGLVAGALTTLAFVPQLLHILRTRSARDISWLMFITFTAGVALWLCYGIRLGALPLVVANVVTLALAIAILVLKWRYDTAPDARPHAPRPRVTREHPHGNPHG